MNMRRKTTQPNSSWCRHYKAIPCHRAVSQRHLREGSRLTMCTGKSIKRKHIFFSGLITACLTRALCCYLQASTFIPTQCDTSQVPPLPPPADFAPVPSYLASIQRRLLGTGLYWELLLIASPTSSSYTSTVLLALSAGLLPSLWDAAGLWEATACESDTDSNNHYQLKHQKSGFLQSLYLIQRSPTSLL